MNHYSGKFVLRLPPDLHQILVKKSQQLGKSLNQLCLDLLFQVDLAKPLLPQESLWNQVYECTFKVLQKKFGKKLLGMIGFGSQVTGHQTESSDIDLLLVLDASVPLTRSLYRWWDSQVLWTGTTELNPHFVHLPKKIHEASGIWFEIAQNFHLLYQQKKRVTPFLGKALLAIQEGKLRQYWSHGHPYWVWR